MWDVAGVLSSQPGLSASVSCFAGVLRGTDSAEPPLELRLDTSAACEGLLGALLRMMAQCLTLCPLGLASRLTSPRLHVGRNLLLSSRPRLQASAMRYLAAALNSAPLAPCSLGLLLDSLGLATQRLAAEQQQQQQQQVAEAEEQREWWQQLLALLRVLHDLASARPSATALLMPRIHSLAVAAATSPRLPAGLQQQWCELVRGTLLAQPLLLEDSCARLLAAFPLATPACRQLLLQCLELYLHLQQQLCGAEAVGAAFVKAAWDARLATEVGGYMVPCCSTAAAAGA